jgi:predicted secreted protein
MADVTIYKPATLTISVIDGNPPADQSALVASLQGQVATLTASLATATTARDAALAKVAIARADAQARKDADAAKVDGQALLDALA